MSRWCLWSNYAKERVCRYLLHRYLGHFFQEHLSLDQLSLDLYKGCVTLRDIHLEIWAPPSTTNQRDVPFPKANGSEGGGVSRCPGARPGAERSCWESPGL
ncbi:Autophagy-related protein 2-like protein A [Heterocephalus glaber]|uniref:Autophagy-related protein 2-like protein A n=1 Tax=Heterocephalus glaber TaxID=10181 RepID=G5B6N3_HETGA|nr:Autophagy-related protein 2-like protein A [Heterocephalus glaber]